MPAWYDGLLKVTPDVKPGAPAWATLPQAGGELAELAVVRVDAISDGFVSVIDKTGQRVDGVPGALVHATGDARGLRQGSAALFYTWTTPGWLGRVSRSVRGEELRVQYDWAGTTKETAVDHAEAPRRGIAPLAFVAYPKAGITAMGQILALDASRAWLLTASGHVEVQSRAALDHVDPLAKELAVGDAVRAYRWATGLVPGSVTRVLEPGVRYEVTFGPREPATGFFVTALVSR